MSKGGREHLLRYYAAALGEPEQIGRILGVTGGAIPFEEVYSRERISAALQT
jgi:hypothetical protein